MEIDGIPFTVEKPVDKIALTCDFSRDLMDCYDKPSIYKK